MSQQRRYDAESCSRSQRGNRNAKASAVANMRSIECRYGAWTPNEAFAAWSMDPKQFAWQTKITNNTNLPHVKHLTHERWGWMGSEHHATRAGPKITQHDLTCTAPTVRVNFESGLKLVKQILHHFDIANTLRLSLLVVFASSKAPIAVPNRFFAALSRGTWQGASWLKAAHTSNW